MRSGTSFFNGTVYRKTLTRFWPLWASALVFWGLLLPLNALMRLQQDAENDFTTERLARFAMTLGDYAGDVGVVIALFLGLAAAMAVCSHLYSARSANFMAALPVRREGQFVSCYLAGLTGLMVPNGVIFLLTLLVEGMGDQVWLYPLAYWLAAVCAMEFFFYSFAVCLGQFTGHLLALPVYYGVFNALVAAAYFLITCIMEEFYYGFSGFSSTLDTIAMWCTPVVMFTQMDCDVYYNNGELIQRMEGMNAAWIYALAAVALTGIALLLYRRRHIESAGDVVAVRAMHPVFKYGVAVCAGFAFGLLTFGLLGLREPGLMVSIVLWGIAGYFVAQMLLDKSFRVLHAWKGAVAITAAFLLLFAVIAFDLTGFESRVPGADQVASVEISGLSNGQYDSGSSISAVISDSDEVERVIALHQAVVDQYVVHGEYPEGRGTEESWNIRLAYTLRSGVKITRNYYVWDFDGNAAVPGSIWYAVDQLVGDRDFMWEAYGFARTEELEPRGLELAMTTVERDRDGAAIKLEKEDGRALLDAVKEDFFAGRIGRDSARGCTGRTWVVSFEWTGPAELFREELSDDYSYYYDPAADYAAPETMYDSCYISINVTGEATSTLAVLEELTAPILIGEGTESWPVALWTYDEADVRAAEDLVLAFFESEFSGCTLVELSCDKEGTLKEGAAWAEQYDEEEAIIFTSAFDTGPSGGDGSLNPNDSYTGYRWILTRTGNGEWSLRTWGYG